MLCIPQQNPLKYGLQWYRTLIIFLYLLNFTTSTHTHTQTVRTFKSHMYVDNLETS